MGAEYFTVLGCGATPEEAFKDAKSKYAGESRHHEGYSGTIDEKDDFVLFTPEELGSRDPFKAAESFGGDSLAEDPRIRDKWGPAGAVELRGEHLQTLLLRARHPRGVPVPEPGECQRCRLESGTTTVEKAYRREASGRQVQYDLVTTVPPTAEQRAAAAQVPHASRPGTRCFLFFGYASS